MLSLSICAFSKVSAVVFARVMMFCSEVSADLTQIRKTFVCAVKQALSIHATDFFATSFLTKDGVGHVLFLRQY